jgi:glycosyltransferase involved in cell wall biosynthesis
VSILIPVFNRERYLHRAISSALNQSLRDIEVVIVDDHSTDGSIALVEKMMTDDNRLRLITHSENAGTHAARLTAVQNARGTYVLSLDPDDVLLPFIAADALHCALLHDADMVEFQVLEVIKGTTHLFSFLSPPEIESTGLTMAGFFAVQQLNWNIWKRLIKRSVYLQALSSLPRKAKSHRVVYAEDKLHIGLILLYIRKFYFLKELGYIYYRDNPDNSESGAQQTARMAIRQLRYVENGLKFMYQFIANMSYVRWKEIPTGLQVRRKRRRKR